MRVIRSGRCWVPPEWRAQLGLRFWQRTATVAVTGAPDRAAMLGILCGHLPLLAAAGGHLVPAPAGQPGPAPAGARPAAMRYPVAAGPASAGTEGPGWDADGAGLEDAESARRMARRLSAIWPARGVRQLRSAGFLPPHQPGLYAWRKTAHGEHVYRVWPDGSFTPIAVFRSVQATDRHGQLRPHLVAGRPW